MRDFFGNAVNFIFVFIGALIFGAIFVRMFLNLYSKAKTVSAVVAGKEAYDRTLYSKSRAVEIKHEYTVAFKIKKRIKIFNVSQISYDTYSVNQKGILTYRGNKIIDFR